jgi:PTH1 family peptidyl-tRNA hydrolase
MKLFVGLGNPGTKYAGHRHNVGFMAVERIGERLDLGAWRRRFQGHTAEGNLDGERVLLLKPNTYMNDSGRAVGEAHRFFKIPLGDIYVFHDEIDLAPGKLKVKTGGGNAGHNGLRSITAHIGNDYKRVRIGVGHPGVKEVVPHYVLHDFAKAEREWLDPLLDAIADSFRYLARGESDRFLSHVARLIREQEAPDNSNAPSEEPNAKPRAPSSAIKLPQHGEGDGSLASTLKKWLTGSPGKE